MYIDLKNKDPELKKAQKNQSLRKRKSKKQLLKSPFEWSINRKPGDDNNFQNWNEMSHFLNHFKEKKPKNNEMKQKDNLIFQKQKYI